MERTRYLGGTPAHQTVGTAFSIGYPILRLGPLPDLSHCSKPSFGNFLGKLFFGFIGKERLSPLASHLVREDLGYSSLSIPTCPPLYGAIVDPNCRCHRGESPSAPQQPQAMQSRSQLWVAFPLIRRLQRIRCVLFMPGHFESSPTHRLPSTNSLFGERVANVLNNVQCSYGTIQRDWYYLPNQLFVSCPNTDFCT